MRWKIWLRAGLFASLTLWMLGGPFATQVLGLRVPYVKRWLMFIGYGTDICDVRYLAGPKRTPVQRLETLGYEHRWEAPRKVRMLRDVDQARRQGREICRALGVQELTMDCRCGGIRGWKPQGDPEENLCTP